MELRVCCPKNLSVFMFFYQANWSRWLVSSLKPQPWPLLFHFTHSNWVCSLGYKSERKPRDVCFFVFYSWSQHFRWIALPTRDRCKSDTFSWSPTRVSDWLMSHAGIAIMVLCALGADRWFFTSSCVFGIFCVWNSRKLMFGNTSRTFFPVTCIV